MADGRRQRLIIEGQQRQADEQGPGFMRPHRAAPAIVPDDEGGELLQVGDPPLGIVTDEIEGVVAGGQLGHRRPHMHGLAFCPLAGRELVVFVLDIQHDHRSRPLEQVGNNDADALPRTGRRGHQSMGRFIVYQELAVFLAHDQPRFGVELRLAHLPPGCPVRVPVPTRPAQEEDRQGHQDGNQQRRQERVPQQFAGAAVRSIGVDELVHHPGLYVLQRPAELPGQHHTPEQGQDREGQEATADPQHLILHREPPVLVVRFPGPDRLHTIDQEQAQRDERPRYGQHRNGPIHRVIGRGRIGQGNHPKERPRRGEEQRTNEHRPIHRPPLPLSVRYPVPGLFLREGGRAAPAPHPFRPLRERNKFRSRSVARSAAE